MDYRILGPIEVRTGSGWRSVPAAKQRALLGLLLLRPGRVVERDWLVESLWNGRAPASARRLLPHYVWRLRTLLPEGARRLRTVPSGYVLDLAPSDADHGQFTALVAEGRAAVSLGGLDRGVDRLTTGLGLWRGRALADAPAIPAIAAAAGRLDQLRQDARESLADAQLSAGRPGEALAGLAELTTEEPYRERSWWLLMLALHRLGRRPDALAAYRRLWRIWHDQLGVEPSRELRELYRRVLDDVPVPVPVPVPAPAPDREPPAGPVQTGPVRAAPPAPGSRGLPRPAQLPADPPGFTGRASELDYLLAPLPAPGEPPAAVVISAIDGMAGIGKTALAVHAAHRLAPHFPDGQLFIDLHGYTEGIAPVEPGEALERMLRALGVPGEVVPAHLDDRAALWRSTLASRRVLVVLDNAATEAQVRPLLPGTPGCLVLVTGRTRLAGLEGVRPLSLDVLSPAEALALFRNTVGAGQLAGQPPGLLAEIVELCGWLPLAIRVAAVRLSCHPSWRASQLVARLRDHQRRLAELAAGQRSVAAALDLSYHHLGPPLQRMYRLAGLHPGADYDAEAAAALAGTTADRAEGLLDQLTTVNLLAEPAPGRYRFHDLARQHAAETAARRDGHQDRCAAVGRLWDHYLATAAAATAALYPQPAGDRPGRPAPAGGWPRFETPAQAAAWLEVELANLLAAAGHAAAGTGHTVALAAILDHHLCVRGHYLAAEALHTQALAVASQREDRSSELAALTALGKIRRLLGRPGPAADCFRRALAIARETGDRAGEVAALTGLGHADRARGRYGPAAGSFDQALAIARETGHRRGEQVALQGLGFVHLTLGQYQRAADCSERALAIAREIGHRGGELIALSGLGFVNRALGRYRQSGEHFRQALSLARTEGHRAAEVHARWGLGQTHYSLGRFRSARDDFADALAIAREIGDRNGQFEGLHGLGLIRCALGDPGQGLADHRAAYQLATELGHPVDQARALHGRAGAHWQLGEHQPARQHWQQALSILEGLGVSKVEEVCVEDIRARLAGLPGTVSGAV
jgi:DNA-binding SARP family transcriptional activator/Tfp pilus assembly protein PilF